MVLKILVLGGAQSLKSIVLHVIRVHHLVHHGDAPSDAHCEI